MVNEINSAPPLSMPVNGHSWPAEGKGDKPLEDSVSQVSVRQHLQSASDEAISHSDLIDAADSLERIVNSVTRTSVTFSVEHDLSRFVVAVRAVGSDEIIRQFPPEEFLTVAKFIAAQNPELMDEDYLKGILFDQYT